MPKFLGIFFVFLGSNMTKIVDFFAYVCYDYYDIVGGVSGLGKVIKKSPAFRAVEMLTEIDKITHKITHFLGFLPAFRKEQAVCIGRET